LTINNAKRADRGFYTCIGYNDYMKDDEKIKSEGFLRVKDKLAALWPFLGICAEVFVLCAIILIYENRRNKDSENDSDTDQGDQ
jgi:neuroplastin